jgi:hypothetical protein
MTTVLNFLTFSSPRHAKCKHKTNIKFNLFVEAGGFTSTEKKPANYFLQKIPNNCQKKMDSLTVEISLSCSRSLGAWPSERNNGVVFSSVINYVSIVMKISNYKYFVMIL